MLSNRKTIASATASDAEELITALRAMVELSGRHASTVYLEVGNVKVLLDEITLSDGSTVFNIDFAEVD